MWKLLNDEEREHIAGHPDIVYEKDDVRVFGFPYVDRVTDDEWIDHSNLYELFDLEYLFGNHNWWDYWYVAIWYTNPNGVRMCIPLDTLERYDDMPPLYAIDTKKLISHLNIQIKS